MSFWSKLFGGGGGAAAPVVAKTLDYNGYVISAEPFKEGGQWQTCGTVTKTVDGETRSHRFIRADRFSDEDAAADHAILKGQQIVDQLGDRVFN